MICVDIDGTLVDSEHVLTGRTRRTLRRAALDCSVSVVPVSARPPHGIYYLQDELDLYGPIVAYSGALVLDSDRSALLSETMKVSSALKVVTAAKDLGIHASIYMGEEWYIEEEDRWSRQEAEITRTRPEQVSFDEILPKLLREGLGPHKILCMGEPDQISHLSDRLSDSAGHELSFYGSKPTYLEIMSKGVSKQRAIGLLCSRMGIESSEVISVGDGYNDVDMLVFSGLGVAMGNAPSKVKRAADMVTLTNDQDGLAVVVEQMVIGSQDRGDEDGG